MAVLLLSKVIVVCVSPLTALMMDQKEKFSSVGVSCEYICEKQKDTRAIQKVKQGDIQLVFISPEAIISNRNYCHMFTSATYQTKLVAIAVDEAHCI